MKIQARVAAFLLAAGATSAAAVETPFYEVPYIGFNAAGLTPDTARNADVVGGGYHLYGGWPLKGYGNSAIEVRILDYQMRRKIDKNDNFQTSLHADWVYDFGSSVTGAAGFFRGTKFFVNAGLSVTREDSYGDPGTYLGFDAGGGLLVPLGFKGWAVRLDARAQFENNGDLCTADKVAKQYCTEEKSLLTDYQFGVGLQVPLTIFFDKPVEVAHEEECPIAVVDPASGRRDCGAKGLDADGDGTPDTADKCPSTAAGFKVDAEGCVLAQSFDFAAPVLFAGTSATLTPEGKRQLAEIARMAGSEPKTAVTVQVIAGGSGSAGFNAMLADQRNGAVRQALLDGGLKPEQLSDDAIASQGKGLNVIQLMVRP